MTDTPTGPETPPRRFELVVLDLIQEAQSRCGLGWGKWPLGARDVLERLLPYCRRDDPAWPSIERAWQGFLERLAR